MTVLPGLLDAPALAELREGLVHLACRLAAFGVRLERLERFEHLELATPITSGLTTGANGTPRPDATREPLLAEERYSAPSRVSAAPGGPTVARQSAVATSTATDSDPQEPPLFRVGDRCCVFTGGDPCVKPGTVERRELDGRWMVALDRAGQIRVREDEMVRLPKGWR